MLAILRGRRLQPDAGQALDPRRLDAERRERADQRLLEVAAVALHVLAVPRQVEDRVADELAGPVVGGLAAAVGLDDLDLGALGDVQLAGLGAAAERDHRRVLEQQHGVGQPSARDRVGDPPLQLPAFLVADLLAQVVGVPGAAHARRVAACAAARPASTATVTPTTAAPTLEPAALPSSRRPPTTSSSKGLRGSACARWRRHSAPIRGCCSTTSSPKSC